MVIGGGKLILRENLGESKVHSSEKGKEVTSAIRNLKTLELVSMQKNEEAHAENNPTIFENPTQVEGPKTQLTPGLEGFEWSRDKGKQVVEV